MAGPLAWSPSTDLVFSGWIFAVLVFSTYLSRNECPEVFKKKEKKSRKKKTLPPFPGVKETVYLKAYWLLGLCRHWILPPGSSSCPQPPISPPERRPEAKSPRVGLLGPTEIKMELVKENVKKKKKKPKIRGKFFP